MPACAPCRVTDAADRYWLREPAPAGAADPPSAAWRATGRRRRDRRGRVHRPVDRDRADRHRPAPAGRRPRDGDRGLRRERSERRLLRGEPDPRPGATASATFRTSSSVLEHEGIDNLAGAHRLHPDARHRLRPRGDRDPRARRPGLPGRRVPGVGRRGRRARRAARVPRSATRRRPRSTRRSGRPGCTGRRAATSCSIRRSCVRGLARVARERGVAIHEGTRVVRLERRAGGVDVTTGAGATVRARPRRRRDLGLLGLAGRLSSLFVPVYDYVLVSEPLTPEQRAAIGWDGGRACPTRTTSSTTSG